MEVQDPPYRKKVYDLLSSNFSDFKRTEQEFNAKLDTDPAYAEQVYGVLSQNFSDFKRPKEEFITMLGKPKAPSPQQPPLPGGGGGASPTGQGMPSEPSPAPSATDGVTARPPSGVDRGVDRGVLFRNYWNAEGQARYLNDQFRQAQENASSVEGLGGLQRKQEAEIGRLASLQVTYAKAARSSKGVFDRELDATVKEVAAAIPMTMENEGIEYADPTKVMGTAKAVAAKYGVQDPEFEKLVYDRLLAHVDTSIIERDAESRFKEKAKPVIDAEQLRMKGLFKTDSIEYAKAKSFIDASVASASAGAKQDIDAVAAASKQQADAINASLDQAGKQYEQQAAQIQQAAASGAMLPEQAQQQLDALYQGYQEQHGRAQEAISGLNAKSASDVRSINQRYNRRFQEEQRRILEGAERRIDAAAEKFAKEYGSTPEGMAARDRLRELQREAWREAAEARGKRIEAVSDARFMKQSLYGNVLGAMTARFVESLVEGLGGSFKGIASNTGDQNLYLLGEEMQRAFVLPETKSNSFSDLLDAQNFAQSSGQLVGGMLPSLAASTAAAVATGGASVPVQMLASGAAGWGAETLDISGRARDDVYRNTGSRQKADDAGWKSFVGQVQLVPAYAFEGLPFVGKALDFIPTKGLRMVVAAGTEYGTELLQEIPQSIAEQNILQGNDAYEDFWQGLSSMEQSGDLKRLLVTMAPISLLGAGGQVVKKSQKQALEDSVKAYMAKADLSPYVEGAAGQWINRMIAERGRNFSSAVIASMHEGGQIDEARATELVKQQEQVIRAREESRVMGLGKKDTDIYTALSLQMNALRARAESEQSPAAKAVADKRAKEIERSLADFANEGKRQYVQVEFADGTSLLMDRGAAMRALKDPRFIVQSAMQGDVMSIDFQGDGMENLVADFQGSVMNVADAIERIKNEPESVRLNRERKAKNEYGTSQVASELSHAATLPPQIPIADDVDPEVRDAMIRARESLGVRYDPLDDLPEKVSRMFDRIEADKPVDAFSLDEVSDWLYGKYKEVVKMRSDPKRMLTLEQIDSYAETLGEAITTVENYKTKLKEDAAAEPQKAKPEGAAAPVAVAEEPPRKRKRHKNKRQPRIKVNGAEVAPGEALAEGAVTPEAIPTPEKQSAKEYMRSVKEATKAARSLQPETMTVIPSEDKVIGTNAAGEVVRQRSDGSIYRWRNDSPNTRPNGYPDFGGDLSVTDTAVVTPEATPQPTIEQQPTEVEDESSIFGLPAEQPSVGSAGAEVVDRGGIPDASPQAPSNQGEATGVPVEAGAVAISSQSLQDAFGYTPEVAEATVAIADAMGLDKSKIKVVKGGNAGENALFQEQVDGWYSRLDQAVSSKGSTMPASQWKAWMEARAKEGMMSMEEAKWTGLSDWLASKSNEKVTPQQVREFLKENRVKVEVVEKGDGGAEQERIEEINDEIASLQTEISQGGGSFEERQEASSRISQLANERRALENRDKDTKFSQYQLPGGTSYREVLVTLPTKEAPDANVLPEGYAVEDKTNRWSNEWIAVTPSGDRLSANSEAGATQRAIDHYNKNKPKDDAVFRSSHFDEPNILVHLRLNDRTDTDGKKVLFIEEIQSDWAQKGRKEGFGRIAPTAGVIERLEADVTRIAQEREAIRAEADAYGGVAELKKSSPEKFAQIRDRFDAKARELNQVESALSEARMNAIPNDEYVTPSAPFVTDTNQWVELAIKQAVRMAVEGGYDKIAWSTGEQQFNRWGSQAFAWSKGKTGWRIIGKEQSGGEAFAGMEEALAQEAKESDTIITSKEELRDVVEDVMGRERSDYSPENWKTHINKMVDGMWERMQNEDSGTTMPRREGMKGFYDKILPTVVKKVSKRLGGDGVVGEVGLATSDIANKWSVRLANGSLYEGALTHRSAMDALNNGPKNHPHLDFDGAVIVKEPNTTDQQSIAITPEMKAKVSSGVPLMQDAKGAVEFAQGGEAIIRALENPDASTGIHELYHIADEFLFDRSIPEANRMSDAHIDIAEKWAGGKLGPGGDVRAREKAARGFERYLRDGKAPIPELADIFAKFKQWLTDIYKKLSGSDIDVKISPEMRKVFDALVQRGAPKEEAATKPVANTKPSYKIEAPEPVARVTEVRDQKDAKGKVIAVQYSVPGLEEYPLVAYKQDKGWGVTVKGTGADIPMDSQPTARIAIGVASEVINKAGKEKLDKAIDKALAEKESVADKLDKLADDLEKKLRGMAGSFPVPPTLIIGALRTAAKAIRAGESVTKAIRAAIEEFKETKFYKSLSPSDQGKSEREVRENLNIALKPKEPKGTKPSEVKKSAEQSTGVRPEKKKVTVDVRTALKDQIRLGARAAREAKADVRTKQKDFASRIREALKNELYGRLKPRQAEVIIGRAAATNPDNPRAVQRFFDYASKVIADANYAEDLGVAKDLVRKARKLSRNKGVPVNLAEILQGIAMVDTTLVGDLPTFTSMVGNFLRTFEKVSSGKYEMADVRAMRQYLSTVEDEVQKAKEQMLKDELEDLDINGGDLRDAIFNDELEEYLSTLDEEKVSAVREYMNALAIGAKEDLSAVDTSAMSKEDKAVIDAMKGVDLTMLSDAQLADYVFFADNITVNESLDGIGQAAAMVMGVNMAKETAEITGTAGIRTTWPTMNMGGLDMREAVRSLYYGMPNAFARIAGFAHALGDITEAMGDTNIRMGRSSADATLNKEANALNDFLKQQAQKGKKAGREPESTRNKLMEGIVGFILQRVPRYDAQESFEINRDLIAQDIKNVKEGAEKLGKKKGLSREYETIEELYDTYLKDAASAEDVMAAFKKDMPENAAVVQYLIDMQARYADEVLSHNRRFRNQADEKQPNYLPKTYIKSEYATKEQEKFMDGDMKKVGYEKIAEKLVKPYQSGTLKQRTSSRKLRAGTRIDYNLRRNSVQALGENLYDARTSQHWMAIREMFRTEGIENILGGERNARFMQKKAAELYDAQVRKGIKAMFNEDIEKWVDRRSDDVKRYASFLGLAGAWQFVQQASDQFTNTLGMSSRNKKMFSRVPESVKDVYLRNSNGLSDLLELGSIGERARLMAGTRWDTELESQMRRVEKAIGSGNLKAIQDAQEFMADKMFVALRTSDVFNATTQWVQYYKDYLDSKGEKVEDWAEEVKKVTGGDKTRRRAFAYAENKTDLTQGPSDPTRFAPIGRKSSNVIANVVRTATTAFIAFPSSQYARLMQAASEAVSSLPPERKAEARRILASTAASIATFHGTRMVLRPLAIYGMAQVIKGAAEGLMGDDDDEKALAMLALVSEGMFLAKMNDRDFNKAIEEAYKQERKERLLAGEYSASVDLRKRLTDNMKMWYTSAITDLTAGGLPEGVGKLEADMMNRVAYAIAAMSMDPSVVSKTGALIPFDKWSKNPDNTPFPYYGQWSKEADYGMFSMVPDRVGIFVDKFDAVYRDKMEEGGAAYEKEIRPEFKTRFYDRADRLKEFLLTKDEKGLKEYVKTLDPKQQQTALRAFYKAKAMPNVDPWYHVVASEPEPRARALAYWSVYSEASPEERRAMDAIANRLHIKRSMTAAYLKQLEEGTYKGTPEK